MNPMNVLKGYKTHIAAVGLVALAIAAYLGDDTGQALEYITQALAVFGIRSAIGRG